MGMRYATIGAYAGTYLIANFNDRSDIDLSKFTYTQRIEIPRRSQMRSLFIMTEYFITNSNSSIRYDPTTVFSYNSNSFVRGLLEAANLRGKNPDTSLVGWDKAVPRNYFRR
jgi:hypothetical protein